MQKWEITIFINGEPNCSKIMYCENQSMAITYADTWCTEIGGTGFKVRKIGESI